MTDHDPPQKQELIDELCSDYVDGLLDQTETQRLIHGLLIDDELRSALQRWMLLDDSLRLMVTRGETLGADG